MTAKPMNTIDSWTPDIWEKKNKCHRKKKLPQKQAENLTTEEQQRPNNWEGGASSPTSAGFRHK